MVGLGTNTNSLSSEEKTKIDNIKIYLETEGPMCRFPPESPPFAKAEVYLKTPPKHINNFIIVLIKREIPNKLYIIPN
jgi:hypothetical protein